MVRQGLRTLFLASHSLPETEVLRVAVRLEIFAGRGSNRQLTRLLSQLDASTIPPPKEKNVVEI